MAETLSVTQSKPADRNSTAPSPIPQPFAKPLAQPPGLRRTARLTIYDEAVERAGWRPRRAWIAAPVALIRKRAISSVV